MDGNALDTVQLDHDADLYEIGFNLEEFERAIKRFWRKRGMAEPIDDFETLRKRERAERMAAKKPSR